MAIKIQTEKPEIPVEIGNLRFSFDVSDESIKKFREDALKIQKELENIESIDNDKEALEAAKNVLHRGYSIILGDGSFEKIYELSPSVIICMKYLEQIVVGIEEELRNKGYSQTQKEKAQKYISNKKK